MDFECAPHCKSVERPWDGTHYKSMERSWDGTHYKSVERSWDGGMAASPTFRLNAALSRLGGT